MLILFSNTAPHPIADELLSLGLPIREAIAISEVFALVEQYPDAPILITSDVESNRAQVIQERYPTLQLKYSTKAADVLCELSHLIPGNTLPV
jgi:hypothetical protein